MDFATLSGHISMLVSEFLEEGGDPNMCAELLREIADVVANVGWDPVRD